MTSHAPVTLGLKQETIAIVAVGLTILGAILKPVSTVFGPKFEQIEKSSPERFST